MGATALTSAPHHVLFDRKDSRDRDQDSTSEENIWDQHIQSKDLEVSNEKVRVGSICNDNFLVWKTKYRFPKRQRSIRKLGSRSLHKRSLFASRLENISKSLASVKHEPYCREYSDSDGGGNDGSDERWGRRGLGVFVSGRHDGEVGMGKRSRCESFFLKSRATGVSAKRINKGAISFAVCVCVCYRRMHSLYDRQQ